jgi:lysozyme
MKISENGKDLIKQFEGCRLMAYKDMGNVYTIGYGHTGYDVWSGLSITQDDANTLLNKDLEKFEATINGALPDLNQNQFDACVCLAYNIGAFEFTHSSVMQAILNDRCGWSIKREWLKFARVKGQVEPGLLLRRQKEYELFSTEPDSEDE